MLAVSDEELVNIVPLTVTPAPPNDAVAPLTKFVPVKVTLKLLAPWSAELGLADVRVGDATLTDGLAVLWFDQLFQTAVTLYVYVPPGMPDPEGLPLSTQLVDVADRSWLGELPHAGVVVAPANRWTK